MDACANCGREIGALETPHVWRENVVCALCHGVLTRHAGPVVLTDADVVPTSTTPPPLPQSPFVAPVRAPQRSFALTLDTKTGTATIIAAVLVSLFLGVVVIAALVTLVSKPPGSRGSTSTANGTAGPQGFSAWDGSHYGLVKAIKDKLHDANSFEHVETKFWDKGDHYVVIMKYRATNGFGAKVLNSAKAECDKSGNFIRFLE